MAGAAPTCIFCQIVAGSVPAAIEARGADWVAFADRTPQAPVHVLVVPHRHVDSVNAFGAGDESLIGRLVCAAREVAARRKVDQSGYRLVWNVGADGGQSVGHVHLHVLGGRRLAWPPG